MNWRDLFYFSKGERRAFTLLLSLVSISWILLYRTDPKAMPIHSETDAYQEEKPQASVKEPVTIRKTTSTKQTKRRYTKTFQSNKYPKGTVVELNTTDTTVLKKIPGIGSTFARRIIKYRELLGGFHSVEQLAEVYGIDADRYEALTPWFRVDTTYIRPLEINTLPFSTLLKHPYLEYQQVKVILQLRKQKGILTGWENLQLLEEFTEEDRKRLAPYLSFKSRP
ncbi:MAG: helix-hairpin-helix domain-containing protein [Parabacteroides distasonis]|nr:helix-hairpin-helix domain-containing protein [Parabacteroides distasonis]